MVILGVSPFAYMRIASHWIHRTLRDYESLAFAYSRLVQYYQGQRDRAVLYTERPNMLLASIQPGGMAPEFHSHLHLHLDLRIHSKFNVFSQTWNAPKSPKSGWVSSQIFQGLQITLASPSLDSSSTSHTSKLVC